jgi:hypothetical protein
MCDIFEYAAGTRATDGMKTTGDSITVLRDDAKSKALYQIMFSNPPVKNPLSFVPKDASDFSINSGINLKAVYETAVKMLKEDIPQGEEALSHVEELKKEGFDIEADLLSWVQGAMVMSSQPGPNAYAPGDWVFMLKVSDEAKCKAQLDKLVAMAEPMLSGQQQGSIAPADIPGAEGFRTVNHQMLMMMGGVAPTFGVKGGWMILGSNAKYIEKTLATIGGGENVSKNARFEKEGLQPSGDVLAMSFADQTKLGEQIGAMLGMLPMAKMSIPDIQKQPVLDGLIDIAARFGRVLRKLDFLNSSSTLTTMDGNVIRMKTLTTYREPPAPAKKTESDAEKSEGAPKE